MELYHASKEIVQYPEIRKAKYTKDFSWGFYCTNNIKEVEELMKIFSSFISDEISNFNTDLYYQNPSYLEWSYMEGKLLE